MSRVDAPALDARAARLYHRYCLAVDDGDLDELARLVVPDVRMTRADGTRHGVEPFLDVYREFNAAKRGISQHVVSNVLAERATHGGVETRAYFQATMLDEHETRLVCGTYADVHVEHGGEYLIAHMVIEVQRVLVLPPAARP